MHVAEWRVGRLVGETAAEHDAVGPERVLSVAVHLARVGGRLAWHCKPWRRLRTNVIKIEMTQKQKHTHCATQKEE